MTPPRRTVDLRRLPHGLAYVIALVVAVMVVALAWLASRGASAPGWWENVASPAILWVSPVLFVLLLWRWWRVLRRRRDGEDET